MENGWVHDLFLRRWWSYADDPAALHFAVYHAFNLVEGAFWLACSVAVLRRYVLHHRSALELLYALAFLTFGLSDLREAWFLDSWLVWAKAVNLGILLWLRHRVRRKVWPEARLL